MMSLKQISLLRENEIDAKGIEIAEQMLAANDELFDTMSLQLLSARYTDNFSVAQLSRLACDRGFQEKLFALDDERYKLFLRCSQKAQENGSNWVVSTAALVEGLQNPKFAELTANVLKAKNPNLDIYNVVINTEENYFNISNEGQLNNYNYIRKTTCKRILANPQNEEDMPEIIRQMPLLDRVKFAKCELETSLSLSQAKLLCQKYGWKNSASSAEAPKNELLQKLSDVILAENAEDVKKVDFGDNLRRPNEMFEQTDTNLRQSFATMYNQAFYHPRSEDKVATETVNGKTVDVYDAGVNFAMCSHVVGAFSEGVDEKETHYDRWNMPKRQSHVFCTRLIANEALETAGIKEDTLCLGFTDFEPSALVASAPWDMASISCNREFDTVGVMDANKIMNAVEGSGARFLSPLEQVNNTRTEGNETNWDRFTAEGSKKQPSYLIYVADSLSNEDYKNSPNYQNSVRAAAQFGVPVVMIDREKVIANEHKQIDSMMQEYAENHNSQLMKRIIERFENNRTTGYAQKCENIYKAEFPLMRTDGDGKFKSLEQISEELLKTAPENAQALADSLISQAIKSSNQHQSFSTFVYGIKEKYPNVKIDVDKQLAEHLGITQKNKRPRKISQFYMRSFYEKSGQREEPLQQKTPQKTEYMSQQMQKAKGWDRL